MGLFGIGGSASQVEESNVRQVDTFLTGGNGFYVLCPLPGIDPSSLKVKLQQSLTGYGGLISIFATRPQPKEQRYSGNITYGGIGFCIEIPTELCPDLHSARVSYIDGMLRVDFNLRTTATTEVVLTL